MMMEIGNWPLTMKEQIIWDLQYYLKFATMLKNDCGTFGRSALWVFDCWNRPTNSYWTQTEYTSIMKKIESWIGDVQR